VSTPGVNETVRYQLSFNNKSSSLPIILEKSVYNRCGEARTPEPVKRLLERLEGGKNEPLFKSCLGGPGV
jgi:hypothetical protein